MSHAVPCIRLHTSDLAAAAGWTYDRAGPSLLLRCDAESRVTELRDATGVRQTWADPLDALAWLEGHILSRPPSSGARWIGFLGYDLGRLFEDLPSRAKDDLALPLFAFTFHDGPAAPAPYPPGQYATTRRPLASTFSRDGYLRAVDRAIRYVEAGDVFQVNLSQRFTAGCPDPPAAVYDRLRTRAPARYGAYLDHGDYALLCNSPELFLRVTPDPADGRRRVVTRPIKGTRPLAPGMAEELRNSAKDQAELNMIVDLERNDLGRVCETGTVRVTERRSVEAHPTVYHGVATVEGTLRADVTFVNLLRATFPGGSVTGAPKIRAMQIIDELEPVRRGPYCGAIGYLAAGGQMEWNVAIRTMVVKDGLVHIPVGGGVVADSYPAAEYDETLVKARAMFAAVGLSADESRAQGRS